MEERDKALLDTLDELIELAPELGLFPFACKSIKNEVKRIMQERDVLKNRLDAIELTAAISRNKGSRDCKNAETRMNNQEEN